MPSHVQLFATPQTATRRAPLSMGCPGQEYWSGLSLPLPGNLPDPGIKPASPALAGGFFSTRCTWQETVELHKPTLLKLCWI